MAASSIPEHHEVANQNQDPKEPPLKKMRVSELLGLPVDPVVLAPDDTKTFLTSSGTWAAAEQITKAMPSNQGLPLTILTGFLGAGKSTVLNYILRADHGLKIAVLINEFGEVSIDDQLVDSVAKGEEGEAVVLNNGCICCTVSNGFIDAVHTILERADATGSIPDYFIVETTGLADPKPILDSVSATELSEELYVDQVLTVVDASAWSDVHYGSKTARQQIESADTILLSKTDLADDDKVKEVVSSIVSIRPSARILKSQKGYVPISALFDLGISLTKPKSRKKKGVAVISDDANAKDNVKDKVGKDIGHHHEGGPHFGHKHGPGEHCDHDHKHDGDDKTHLEEEGFTSISFVSEYPFSLRRFKDDFMDALPSGVFRSKGLLWFTNYESRFIFHWSGARYNVEEGEWPENVPHKNQLVVIGRDLEREHITKMLEACVVRPGEESEEEYMGEYGEEDYGQIGLGDDDDDEEGLERVNEYADAEAEAMAEAEAEAQEQAEELAEAQAQAQMHEQAKPQSGH